jgi:hypothetical protein
MLVQKNYFGDAYDSQENFSVWPPPPPPVDNIFGKIFYDSVKIVGNVGQNTTTPPPNVDGFATSL